MNLLDIILLAIALAMDCFAVSIVSGVLTQKRWLPRMAILFGIFQAMMPLIGWIGISFFRQNIEAYDHWIAFALLFLIGGNMIRESFSPEEEHFFNPLRLRTQLLLAVATSIDAMAIGISFACTGFNEISQLLLPIIIIGIVSSLFSTIGTRLGARFGRAISHRLKPELLGGLILIAIGIKILITHLIEES
jgi:putative Mn2+ efflux pump MntP